MRTFIVPCCVWIFFPALAVCAQPPANDGAEYVQEFQRGSRLLEEGRAKLAEATEAADQPEANARLRQESRAAFIEAQKAFGAALGEIEAVPRDDRDDRQTGAYVQLRLLEGTVLQDIANTYASEEPERKKTLERAADTFRQMHKDYRQFTAGLFALCFEGICRHEAGNMNEAEEVLEEFLDAIGDMPNSHPFIGPLRKQTLWRAVDCQLQRKPPKYEGAIFRATRWLKDVELDADDADLLQMHFQLARAYMMLAAATKSAKVKLASQEYAAGHAQFVAKRGKTRAAEAQEMLKQLPADLVAEAAEQERPPLEDFQVFGTE